MPMNVSTPSATTVHVTGACRTPVLHLALGSAPRSSEPLLAAICADGTVRIVDVVSRRIIKGIPSTAFASSSDPATAPTTSQDTTIGPSVCLWRPRADGRDDDAVESLVASGTSVHIFVIDTSDPAALLKKSTRSYYNVGHDELNALVPLHTEASVRDNAVDRLAFADDEGNIGILSLYTGAVDYVSLIRKGKTFKAHGQICTSLLALPRSQYTGDLDDHQAVLGEVGLVSGGLDCRVRLWRLNGSSSVAELDAEIDAVALRSADAASLQMVNPPYVYCLASLALSETSTADDATCPMQSTLVAAGLGDGGILLYKTPRTLDASAAAHDSADTAPDAMSTPARGKNRAERRKAEKAARKLKPRPGANPNVAPQSAQTSVEGVRQVPNEHIKSITAHGHAITCIELVRVDDRIVMLTGSADASLRIWHIGRSALEAADTIRVSEFEATLIRSITLRGKPNHITTILAGEEPSSGQADDDMQEAARASKAQVAVALTDGTIAFFSLDELSRKD